MKEYMGPVSMPMPVADLAVSDREPFSKILADHFDLQARVVPCHAGSNLSWRSYYVASCASKIGS